MLYLYKYNRTLFIKMNAYFMNQYFENDNYLVFVFDEGKSEIKTLFSRVEEYSLYRGLNRGVTKPYDYKNYARIYIRADTKKTEIKRKYQKVMEFYADASSLLLALFYALTITFEFINSFYAEHSLNRRLFYFKDIENNIDISKKSKEIRDLITLAKPHLKEEELRSSIEIKPNKNDIFKVFPLKNNEDIHHNFYNDNINIYNIRKNRIIEYNDKEQLSTEKELVKVVTKKKIKKKKQKVINQNKVKNGENEINLVPNFPSTQREFKMVREFQVNIKTNEYNTNLKKIKFTYNIGDIIVSSFFCCCMTKNLKAKKNLTNKANDILYRKLDVYSFVKNMLLLDIMNKTLLNAYGGKREGIIKFISRPIISLNEENKENNFLFESYNENDFDKFYNEFVDLLNNTERTKDEKELIYLTNKKLKSYI